MTLVQVELPDPLDRKLKEMAEAQGRPLSEVMRLAVEFFITHFPESPGGAGERVWKFPSMDCGGDYITDPASHHPEAEQFATEPPGLADLRAEIAVGLDELEKGEMVEFSAEEIIAEGAARRAGHIHETKPMAPLSEAGLCRVLTRVESLSKEEFRQSLFASGIITESGELAKPYRS